jgi:hypothetical protein
MRKSIGRWLLALGTLLVPAAAHAQQLAKWGEPPSIYPAANAAAQETSATRPYTARAQDTGEAYMVPPVDFTGPLSHPRYEDGGFFTFGEFMYYRQTRPLLSQSVAFRGFIDTNGGISGTGTPGTRFGSFAEALNTNMVNGAGNFQPGMNIGIGYRFKNGISVTVEWMHLAESRYAATAGLLPGNFLPGQNLADTFLFAPVSNFPASFGGNPANVVINGSQAFGSTFGIWNAASNMEIQFIQRFEQVQITQRIPIWETECYRAYGIVGPRAIVMWEKFEWRTVDTDTLGQATADTTALYNNIVSNRLYGVFVGSGHDWYLHSGRCGAFAVDLSLCGALYMDFVKGRARYELGDKSEAATRSRRLLEAVPGVDGKLGLCWYPWEAIQVRLGYSFMALFNTVASPRPIDFNFGTIDPPFNGGISRLLHGVDVGIGFIW